MRVLPRRRLVPVAVLALGLLVSGCSDDDAPAGDQTAPTSTVRSGLAALFAGDNASEADVADGVCFAEALTERVSIEELKDAGVVDESLAVATEMPVLEPGLAEHWVDAQFACTDFAEQSARALVDQSKGAVDPEAYAACLREELSEDQQRAAVLATLTGDWESPAVARLSEAQTACAEAAQTTG